MAKTWYPVIDYATCTECGICTDFCPKGVYDKDKAPAPVVQNPENCIDHCHGCGNLCPEGAITYVGDDTGWTPPKGAPADGSASCGCGGSCAPGKKVLVEYLYLDLNTCDRCIGTDRELVEVMNVLTPALQLAGYSVEYRKVEMTTAELAQQYRFLSSPTIRVNGQDIGGPVKENSCGCCGEISGTDVDCRVWEAEGQTYEVPPKELLAEEILRAVFVKAEGGSSAYEMQENLETFFIGKGRSSCSCGGLALNG
jgi:NAD-dependent dihydropyrimidine dehydrogenase PreA subunit